MMSFGFANLQNLANDHTSAQGAFASLPSVKIYHHLPSSGTPRSIQRRWRNLYALYMCYLLAMLTLSPNVLLHPDHSVRFCVLSCTECGSRCCCALCTASSFVDVSLKEVKIQTALAKVLKVCVCFTSVASSKTCLRGALGPT